LLGRHQADNAALALAAVRRLDARSDEALRTAAVRGLEASRLAARVEVVESDPWVVVDCAHTDASARALRASLAPIPRSGCELVLSISADKDLEGILALLLPLASRVCFTRAEPHRSLDPAHVAAVASRIEPDIRARVVEDPSLAVRSARERLVRGELLCVTGSVYLAGIAREVLMESKQAQLGVGSDHDPSGGNLFGV
jgi:dihydrofolate synthase/folylpolyglutamate synthase